MNTKQELDPQSKPYAGSGPALSVVGHGSGVGTETHGHAMIGKGTPLNTNSTLYVCAEN